MRQVLTHTAGFPFAPLGYPTMLHRAERLEAMAKWRLTYEPGTQLQFHLTSAAWVIAELVERRTGLPFAEYLRTEIVEPLGLGFVLPVPADRYEALVTAPVAIDRTSDDQQVDPWGPWYLANPDVLAGGEPSHSIVGSAADVAMFFQALVHSGLWRDEAVAEGTRIHVSMPPAGDQLYGGSDRKTNIGLFVTISGDDHGELAAVDGIAADVRQRRRPVPARLHGSRDGRVVRLPHQRLPDGRLRLQPPGHEPHHQPGQPGQRPGWVSGTGEPLTPIWAPTPTVGTIRAQIGVWHDGAQIGVCA